MKYSKQFIEEVNRIKIFVFELSEADNIAAKLEQKHVQSQLLELIADDEYNYLLAPIVDDLVENSIFVEQLITAAIETKYNNNDLVYKLIECNNQLDPNTKLFTKLLQADKLEAINYALEELYDSDDFTQLIKLLAEIEQGGELIIDEYLTAIEIDNTDIESTFRFLDFINIEAYAQVLVKHLEKICQYQTDIVCTVLNTVYQDRDQACNQCDKLIPNSDTDDYLSAWKEWIASEGASGDIDQYINIFEQSIDYCQIDYQFFSSSDYVKVFEHYFGKLDISDLNQYATILEDNPTYLYKLLYFHALDPDNIYVLHQLVIASRTLVYFDDLDIEGMINILNQTAKRVDCSLEQQYLISNAIMSLNQDDLLYEDDINICIDALNQIEASLSLVPNAVNQKLMYLKLAVNSQLYQMGANIIEKYGRMTNSLQEILAEMIIYIGLEQFELAKARFDQLQASNLLSAIDPYIQQFYQIYFEEDNHLKIEGYKQLYKTYLEFDSSEYSDYLEFIINQLRSLEQYQLVVELIGEVEYYHPVQIYALSKIDKSLAVEKIYQLFIDDLEALDETDSREKQISIYEELYRNLDQLTAISDLPDQTSIWELWHLDDALGCNFANCYIKSHQIEGEFRYQF